MVRRWFLRQNPQLIHCVSKSIRCPDYFPPRLVGSRLPQHHEYLCGSGSGNEGQGAGHLRSPWGCSLKELEEGRHIDAVPAKPLIENYVAWEQGRILVFANARSPAPHNSGGHKRVKAGRIPSTGLTRERRWPSRLPPRQPFRILPT